MNSLRRASRWLHLASRTVGDVDAARRGRLPKRLVRRAITRNVLRRIRW